MLFFLSLSHLSGRASQELLTLDRNPIEGGCWTKGTIDAVLWRAERLIATGCGTLPVGGNSSANEALGQRSRSECPSAGKDQLEM